MFAAPQPAAPSLQVVSRAPLVVSGSHFRPKERVTLKVGGVTVLVTTTRAGLFRRSLPGVVPDRCSAITATGARGDHATVPPARTMCAPAGAP